MSVPAPQLDREGLAALLESAFPGADGSVTIDEVTPTGVTVTLRVTDRHGRPGGTVSGPAVMSLVDTAAYLAILSRVGPELLAVTTSLHIDFVRKPALADITASAELVKLGRRLAVVDVTVRSVGSEDPVAKSLVTYSRHQGGAEPRDAS